MPARATSLGDAVLREELTGEELELLVDLVTEELAERGFDDAYGATPYGAQLEELIDVLNAD